MIVYHVCGLTKFIRYMRIGHIKPPVRAWIDIKEAERFSKSTGRQIIMRLKFKDPLKLEGHKGKAVYLKEQYELGSYLGFRKDKHRL